MPRAFLMAVSRFESVKLTAGSLSGPPQDKDMANATMTTTIHAAIIVVSFFLLILTPFDKNV